MSPILRSLLPTLLSPKNECSTRGLRSAKCHFFCLFRNFSSLLLSSSSPPALIHAPLTLDIYHISILDVQGHSRFRGLLTLFLCSFWGDYCSIFTTWQFQLDLSESTQNWLDVSLQTNSRIFENPTGYEEVKISAKIKKGFPSCFKSSSHFYRHLPLVNWLEEGVNWLLVITASQSPHISPLYLG